MTHDLTCSRLNEISTRITNLVDEMWPEYVASVGDGGDDTEHLHRCRREVLLADAEKVRVGQVPGLTRQCLALPILVGDDSGCLIGEVDSGSLSQPKHTRVAGERVRTKSVVGKLRTAPREAVEVDV